MSGHAYPRASAALEPEDDCLYLHVDQKNFNTGTIDDLRPKGQTPRLELGPVGAIGLPKQLDRLGNGTDVTAGIDEEFPSQPLPAESKLPKDTRSEDESSYASCTADETWTSGDEDDSGVQMDKRRQVIIDDTMSALCAWLDSKVKVKTSTQAGTADEGQAKGGSAACPDQAQSGGAGPSATNTRGHRRGNNRSRKRRKTDQDGDGSDSDDPARRPDPRETDCIEVDEPRRFACPYFRRDPHKYCRETTCVGPGWVEIHRVKSHLHRRHALPPQCPRCWQTFKTDALRDLHLQDDPPCQVRSNDTILDGFTKAQERRLRSRKKTEMNATDEGKWREMYLILFPDDDPETIPSPYQPDIDAMPCTDASDSITPADFAVFARREFPRLVRNELDTLLESEFTDVEEKMRSLVHDIVQRLQSRLITLYERTWGVRPNEENTSFDFPGRSSPREEIPSPSPYHEFRGGPVEYLAGYDLPSYFPPLDESSFGIDSWTANTPPSPRQPPTPAPVGFGSDVDYWEAEPMILRTTGFFDDTADFAYSDLNTLRRGK